jgi:hypothetical protein
LTQILACKKHGVSKCVERCKGHGIKTFKLRGGSYSRVLVNSSLLLVPMLSSLEDRARLAEIEAQIRDLELSLAELPAEKTLVRERSTYPRAVLTLPNEIVSEIFMHFLPLRPPLPITYGAYFANHSDANLSPMARSCPSHP